MTRRTTLTLSLALAAAVALPTAGSAFAVRPAGPGPAATSTATSTPTAVPTTTTTDRPTSRPTITRRVRTPKPVLAGTLAAVDATAGRITVTVHGGRDEALRGRDVVVALTPTTVLRQDGTAVTVDGLRTGGHVSAQVTRAADSSFTATRVTVDSGEDAPTSSPTSSPTGSPTGSPTAEHD